MTKVIVNAVTREVGTKHSLEASLDGKRVAMVMFSSYPADPRPRRAVEALLREGMKVDLICLKDDFTSKSEKRGALDIHRVPIKHRRGRKFSYVYNYLAFIAIGAAILGIRSLRHRYDLVYVHNMPDILVLSSIVPKVLGAKVILDQHDPMPELMMSMYGLENDSRSVRLLTWLEKKSMALADLVITVNIACKRLFGSRSCPLEKIAVVMNAPDNEIFAFRAARSYPRRIGSDPFVIMYHGSLVERNGLDLAIDALVLTRATIANSELRIYGRKTSFLDYCLEKAAKNGVRERVQYLGPKSLEEIVQEIEGCDLGIIPNPRNRFTQINTPTRIFEYLALGRPVIAPKTTGVQDYFDPGSLLYFEPGSAKDLAAKIEYAYCHHSELVTTTEQGQRVYLEHTWPRQEKTLVALIKQLLIGGMARNDIATLAPSIIANKSDNSNPYFDAICRRPP